MPEEIRVTEPLDRLAALLIQAPTPICVTRGSTHRVEIMNLAFEAMAGVTGAQGRAFSEIDSGLGGEQLQLMEQAFRRGERLEAPEVALGRPARTGRGRGRGGRGDGAAILQPGLRAAHDRAGVIDGLMISAVDVSSHVASRRDFESAQRRARFLGDASAALAESLDYARTLHRVAELAVPCFADWCTVSEVDEAGVLRRLAVVHRDPARSSLVAEYERRFPPSQHRAGDLVTALGSNRAILRARCRRRARRGVAEPDHLRVMRGLGCASCIIAPMIARGRHRRHRVVHALGARPPVRRGRRRGRRGAGAPPALAIDNARLYRAAQRREETMRFFAEASAVLSSSLDYEAAFDKVARLVVPSFADGAPSTSRRMTPSAPSPSRTSTPRRPSSRATCSAALGPIPTRVRARLRHPHRALRAAQRHLRRLSGPGGARPGAAGRRCVLSACARR